MSNKHFDYFVIGAGSGGVRSARYAAAHGAKVGIAEYSRIGGTCVNVGCVPKKLMAYAADYHAAFEDSRGYGWNVGEPSFDWPSFIAAKDKEIQRLNDAYTNTLNKNGVEIIRGFAKFIDKNTIDIDGEIITADHILIATGGKPRALDIEGGEHCIDSDAVFYLPEQPKHITIFGGGYIAVEFAHIFSGMGSDVTLIYRGDLFLRGFDRDIREFLAQEMRKQNIDLRFNTTPNRVLKHNENDFTVHMGDEELKTNLVFAAIGRTPKLENMGLEDLGVKRAQNGQIIVNDRFETNVENIYAVGDITNKFHLTPVATAEGGTLANRLFGEEDKVLNYNNIATAVFSSPNIATVGYGEEAAKDAGFEVETHKADFRPMRHTLSGRDERILMKVVVDVQTDRVLGVHMVGADSAEIMQGFAVALNAGVTYTQMRNTIGIHPTSAEEFVTL